MSGNDVASGFIVRTLCQEARHTSTNSLLNPASEQTKHNLEAIKCLSTQHADNRQRDAGIRIRKAADGSHMSKRSITIKDLLKAIRQADRKRFSALLARCGRLEFCTDHVSHEEGSHDFTQHDARCGILNGIIEEVLSCTVDCSGIVQALVESNVHLHGAHNTINGRRLWFWAALKDHINLLSYMIASGFPVDQGIKMSDRSILTKVLAPNSDTLPQGITALFAALIANAYSVALYLIEQRAALRLHFHEHKDMYTVPVPNRDKEEEDSPVTVDALMVLAPRFPVSYPSTQNKVYLRVIECLLSHGLNPSLPSNLWIEASSVFFMSLTQGRPPHEYVQEVSFLLKVALYGHVEVMKFLVEYGADIEARAFHGLSLLHFAVRSRNLEMVEYIAELADDIDIEDEFGYSALHHAVAMDLPDIVKCLLDYDADVDAISKNGLTPLHLAVSLKDVGLCDLLLQHDAEVNTCLSDLVAKRSFNHAVDWYDLTSTEMVFGSTPLMSALCPDKMVYIYTVSRDSNSDATDTDSTSDTTSSLVELTAMFDIGSEESLLVDESKREISKLKTSQVDGVRGQLVKLLLQHGAKPCEVGYFFKKRLDLAKGDASQDRELSPFAYEVEWCHPLSLASKTTTEAWSMFTQTSLRNVRGTPDVVRMVLKAAKANLTPYMINEALSAACFTNVKTDGNGRANGRFRLSLPTIEMLLDRGADPSQRNNQGFTLLHLACLPWGDRGDHCNLVERLLQDGAYIETRCPSGKTPLHWAAAWSFNTVNVLLRHGADTFIVDDFMRDPLHYACSNPDSRLDSTGIRLLLQHRYHRENMSGGETRLALACDNEWSEKDCKLLTYLADPELPQHTSHALISACSKDRVKSIRTMCQCSQSWQVYSLRDQQGRTPLIAAVKTGSFEMVSLILQGITIAYRDRRSLSADIAHGGGHQTLDEPMSGELIAPSQTQQITLEEDRQVSSGDDTTDITCSNTTANTLTTIHTPPPYIEGLLLSEQYVHQGQLMFDDELLAAEDVRPLNHDERAACLNAQDYSGKTALHYAAVVGDREIMQLLLKEPDIDLEPSKSSFNTLSDILTASGEKDLLEMYNEAVRCRKSESKMDRKTNHAGRTPGTLIPRPISIYLRSIGWSKTQCAKLKSGMGTQTFQVVFILLIILWSLWMLPDRSSENGYDQKIEV